MNDNPMTYELRETPGSVPIKSWTRGVPVEAAALEQLDNVARLPFIHSHVAVMPDVHFGIGAAASTAAAERVAAGVLEVPPRHRRLLELVARYPRKPYPELCSLMYGRSDEAAHSTLSAELSQMRSAGLVESVGRGQYIVTPIGLQILGRPMAHT